jgi:hypothetical protein
MKAEEIANLMWDMYKTQSTGCLPCVHRNRFGVAIKEAIELHEASKPKLTDERIAEVSSRFVEWRDSYLIIPESAIDNFARAIEAEVQRQDEQSKWKYPAKGEIAEDGKRIRLFFHNQGVECFGIGRGGSIYDEDGDGVCGWHSIEKWQYAPEVG